MYYFVKNDICLIFLYIHMYKNIKHSDIKYSDVSDFEEMYYIENIKYSDLNIIASKKYKTNNIWKNITMTGFNRKKYKISSHIPNIHDSLSYYLMNKDLNNIYDISVNLDTTDVMLIRQIIDKKTRYDNVNYTYGNKYRNYISLSHRFNL